MLTFTAIDMVNGKYIYLGLFVVLSGLCFFKNVNDREMNRWTNQVCQLRQKEDRQPFTHTHTGKAL